MKGILLTIICGLSLFLLTGCTSSIPLTENESDIISEYVAGVVLKHDKYYDQALITPSFTEEQEEITATPTPTIEPTDDLTPSVGESESMKEENLTEESDINMQSNADFTEIIGKSGIQVEYTGFENENSYSNPYFTIEAEKGNQLIIIHFKLSNHSKKDINLDLSKSEINYQLDINTGTPGKPLLTFLDNDLRFLKEKIEADASIDAVVIYSISNKVDLNIVNVIISKGDKASIIKLK